MVAEKSGISRTLLQNLFERPRPIDKESYDDAFGALFPTEQLIRKFLMSNKEEKQTEYALRIILGLVCAHPVTPPTLFVRNLLEFEKRREGSGQPTEKGYIARGHFVHLVNLYLLGIFIFSYHAPLHSRCSRQLLAFYGRGRENRAGDERMNPYALFATVWAQFVLFHDLGYPVEAVAAMTADTDVSEFEKVLRRFDDVKSSVIFDLTLKSISNLLIIFSETQPDERNSLNELYLKYSKNLFIDPSLTEDCEDWIETDGQDALTSKSLESFYSSWGSATYLPTFSGYKFRAALSIFPDKDLCAVLEDERRGSPILVVLGRHTKKPVLFWFVKRAKAPSFIRRSDSAQLWRSAFFDSSEIALKKGFSWTYFGRDAVNAFESTKLEMFGDKVQDFDNLLAALLSERVLSSGGLTDDGIGPTATLNVFEYLYEMKVKGEVADLLASRFEAMDKALSEEIGQLPEVVSSAVRAQLASMVEQLPVEELKKKIVHGSLQKEVEGLLRLVLVNKKNVIEDIDSRVAKSLARKTELSNGLERVFGHVSEKILEVVSSSDLLPDWDMGGESYEVSAKSWPKAYRDDFWKQIDESLEEFGLPPLEMLLSSYRPPHSPNDHGLVAALVGLAVRRVYLRLLEYLQETSETEPYAGTPSLLRSALVIDSRETLAEFAFRLNSTFVLSLSAVAVHNLYPRRLPKSYKEFRANYNKNPFIFLALLADGMQDWDRAQQINLGIGGGLKQAFYGDSFDVSVVGERYFSIEYMGVAPATEKFVSVRDSLSPYMEGVESLFVVSAIESLD